MAKFVSIGDNGLVLVARGASDGKLGGFGGGLEMKKHLLYLEATASIG